MGEVKKRLLCMHQQLRPNFLGAALLLKHCRKFLTTQKVILRQHKYDYRGMKNIHDIL